MFPFIVETYRHALPEAEQPNAGALVDEAVERAREKHKDFDRFAPGIEHLSTMFFCNHALMPLDVYIEVLYCAVKHSDFAKAWRLQLKRPALAQ